MSACSFIISIALHSEHTISMQIDPVTPKLDRLSLGLTTTAIGALQLQVTVEIVLPRIEGRKGWRVCRQREEERQQSWTASVSDRVMRLKLETEYVIVVVRGDAPGVGRELGEKGKSCRSGLCRFRGHFGADDRGHQEGMDRICLRTGTQKVRRYRLFKRNI